MQHRKASCKPSNHTRVALLLPSILVALLGTMATACRVDTREDLENFSNSMSKEEQLFFTEYEDSIRAGENIQEITHLAARRGYTGTLGWIHTTTGQINHADEQGWTTLLLAAEHGHIDTVRYLVERAGSDVRTRTERRITAVMLAIRGGHTEVVSYLLDRGANINAKTEAGISPLMFAAAAKNPSLVSLLLERGAAPDLLDDRGRSALYYADDEETTRILGEASRARGSDQ